jgi:hypothetical protein
MYKVVECDTFNYKHCSIYSTDNDELEKSRNSDVKFLATGIIRKTSKKTHEKGIKHTLFYLSLHPQPTRINATRSNASVMLIRVGLMLRAVYFNDLVPCVFEHFLSTCTNRENGCYQKMNISTPQRQISLNKKPHARSK